MHRNHHSDKYILLLYYEERIKKDKINNFTKKNTQNATKSANVNVAGYAIVRDVN